MHAMNWFVTNEHKLASNEHTVLVDLDLRVTYIILSCKLRMSYIVYAFSKVTRSDRLVPKVPFYRTFLTSVFILTNRSFAPSYIWRPFLRQHSKWVSKNFSNTPNKYFSSPPRRGGFEVWLSNFSQVSRIFDFTNCCILFSNVSAKKSLCYLPKNWYR